MTTQEPKSTEIANVQMSGFGHKLPEQASIPICKIPRPMSISSWICEWQPMGIRVVVDLPFVGNDRDFLFLIRNGPFIPPWDHTYNANGDSSKDKFRRQLAWNNMRNVFHAPFGPQVFSSKPSIFITQYDYPPPLATMAASFRKWRGTMHYRIRTVAGFATQGYVFMAPLKNHLSPVGVYDEYSVPPSIPRQDASYREMMMNSYILSDTSMFRHIEYSMLFEYPVQWYDQYAWMARRVAGPIINICTEPDQVSQVVYEPHGDNFAGLCVRGELAATHPGAQIAFELEYRADENFQFSDPGLPPMFMNRPIVKLQKSQALDKVKRLPDKSLRSDGIADITKLPTTEAVTEELTTFLPPTKPSYRRRPPLRDSDFA
nr:MAG: putative capsid protein [Polycipiviridae sp. XZN141292]